MGGGELHGLKKHFEPYFKKRCFFPPPPFRIIPKFVQKKTHTHTKSNTQNINWTKSLPAKASWSSVDCRLKKKKSIKIKLKNNRSKNK